MAKLKQIIDGSDKRPAPRPSRGLMKACYETVRALGQADEKRIREYLPAAVDDASQLGNKRVAKALYACKYHGYLIVHDGIYRIAPRTWFNRRQKEIEQLAGTREKPSNHDGSYDVPEPKLPALRFDLLSFILGLALGSWAGYIVSLLV